MKRQSAIAGQQGMDPQHIHSQVVLNSNSSPTSFSTNFAGFSVVHLPESDSEYEALKGEAYELMQKLQAQICDCKLEALPIDGKGGPGLVSDSEDAEIWQGLMQNVRACREDLQLLLKLNDDPQGLETIESSGGILRANESLSKILGAQLAVINQIKETFSLHLRGHTQELFRRVLESQKKQLQLVELLRHLKKYESLPNLQADFSTIKKKISNSLSVKRDFEKVAMLLDEVCNKAAEQEAMVLLCAEVTKEINQCFIEAYQQSSNRTLQVWTNLLKKSEELFAASNLYFDFIERGWILLGEAANHYKKMPLLFSICELHIQDLQAQIEMYQIFARQAEDACKDFQKASHERKELLTEVESECKSIEHMHAELSQTYSISYTTAFYIERDLESRKKSSVLNEAGIKMQELRMQSAAHTLEFGLKCMSLLGGELPKDSLLTNQEDANNESNNSNDLLRRSPSSNSSSSTSSPEKSSHHSPPNPVFLSSPSSSPKKESGSSNSRNNPPLANRTAAVVPKQSQLQQQPPIQNQPIISVVNQNSRLQNYHQPEHQCSCIIA